MCNILFELLLSAPEFKGFYEKFCKFFSDCLLDYVPIAFSRADIDSLASYLARELTIYYFFTKDECDD